MLFGGILKWLHYTKTAMGRTLPRLWRSLLIVLPTAVRYTRVSCPLLQEELLIFESCL